MKWLLRIFIIETLALFAASQIASGMEFAQGLETFLWTALALSVATLLVRPIINFLLLPLNIITFGLFKWLGHTVMLYLVTLVIDNFTINGFVFAGFASSFFDLPPVNLAAGIPALVGFSLIISVLTSLFYWLAD